MNNQLNLLPREAAERLRLSESTLAQWRVAGKGPKFIKWGRKVLYPVNELEAFEKRSLHSAVSVKA